MKFFNLKKQRETIYRIFMIITLIVTLFISIYFLNKYLQTGNFNAFILSLAFFGGFIVGLKEFLPFFNKKLDKKLQEFWNKKSVKMAKKTFLIIANISIIALTIASYYKYFQTKEIKLLFGGLFLSVLLLLQLILWIIHMKEKKNE